MFDLGFVRHVLAVPGEVSGQFFDLLGLLVGKFLKFAEVVGRRRRRPGRRRRRPGLGRSRGRDQGPLLLLMVAESGRRSVDPVLGLLLLGRLLLRLLLLGLLLLGLLLLLPGQRLVLLLPGLGLMLQLPGLRLLSESRPEIAGLRLLLSVPGPKRSGLRLLLPRARPENLQLRQLQPEALPESAGLRLLPESWPEIAGARLLLAEAQPENPLLRLRLPAARPETAWLGRRLSESRADGVESLHWLREGGGGRPGRASGELGERADKDLEKRRNWLRKRRLIA